MIPSAQIVRAYRHARDIYLPGPTTSSNEMAPDEILEVLSRLHRNPEKEYQYRSSDDVLTLSDFLGISTHDESPVVLQLGGGNPETLGAASAIGRAFAPYSSVNLNCGCPSNAVGGRSGGVALMSDPSLVARCVEAMNANLSNLEEVSEPNGGVSARGETNNDNRCTVTVKHRLGVGDASSYDAVADRRKDDTEAFENCKSFVEAITLGGAVAKCHLHARLGLLGEFPDEDDGGVATADRKNSQSLWVPGNDGGPSTTERPREKIDHKRLQTLAKKRSRNATMKNRHVPPLRPNVVNALAAEFPELEFVANGGIGTMDEVRRIVDDPHHGGDDDGNGRPIGAMVGRAAVNHPCAFASADALWRPPASRGETVPLHERPSRGAVLRDYIEYCDTEEERMSSYGASIDTIAKLRRRLVAVPFHLFMGEDGNDAFQRRVKKLTSKTDKIRASSILFGAASFVPVHTLEKCVDDHVPWKDIPVYEGSRHSSALQRVVY